MRHSSAAEDQLLRRQISKSARAMRGAFCDTYIESAVRLKLSMRERLMYACGQGTAEWDGRQQWVIDRSAGSHIPGVFTAPPAHPTPPAAPPETRLQQHVGLALLGLAAALALVGTALTGQGVQLG